MFPGDLTQIDLSTSFVSRRVGAPDSQNTRLGHQPPVTGPSRVPGNWSCKTSKDSPLSSYTLNLTWNSDMAWQCPVKFRVFFPDLTHKPSVSACSETCKIAPSSLRTVPWQVMNDSQWLPCDELTWGSAPYNRGQQPNKNDLKRIDPSLLWWVALLSFFDIFWVYRVYSCRL